MLSIVAANLLEVFSHYTLRFLTSMDSAEMEHGEAFLSSATILASLICSWEVASNRVTGWQPLLHLVGWKNKFSSKVSEVRYTHINPLPAEIRPTQYGSMMVESFLLTPH